MAFPKRLPTRWLAAAAARMTFLSGFGYVAMAYTVSRYLTRPRRRRLDRKPSDLGFPVEEIEVTTSDGLVLRGWVVEPPLARGTVAMFHGMRRNRQQMESRIALLCEAGYRCVAVDHRAHGESRGKRVSFGWYEARDVRAVADWMSERYADQPRFALGMSMGAAAICFAGPECGWSKVILEGVYADLLIAFRRRIGAYYPRWFGDLFPMVIWFTQKRLRIRINQVRPVDAIAAFQGVPLLSLGGERDLLAPPCDVQAVAAAVNPTGEVLVIAGAGHNDMCETGGAAYKQRVLDFLDA